MTAGWGIGGGLVVVGNELGSRAWREALACPHEHTALDGLTLGEETARSQDCGGSIPVDVIAAGAAGALSDMAG